MTQDRKELLIGCGNQKVKVLFDESNKDWSNLVTLDIDPNSSPDILWNLNDLPYPFEDNTFDEIHAYEVLEHCGTQGDWRFFFAQFSEFWRILKPDGKLFASTPHWANIWAWGDPGHTRVISKATLTFLSQDQYRSQIGKTTMTDYRNWYKADFETAYLDERDSFMFVLKAKKHDELPPIRP